MTTSAGPVSRRPAYDGASGLVWVVGVTQGVLPFLAKAFGWAPAVLLPCRLDAPAWWIVSAAVIAAATVALILIDGAKERTASSP